MSVARQNGLRETPAAESQRLKAPFDDAAVTVCLKAYPDTNLMANDQEKEAAARASLRFVKDGQVVGLGTGSTAAYFIQLLGEQVKKGLRIRGIPLRTVRGSRLLGLGIPLTTLDECQQIDVTVDGADEVDPAIAVN